jgi:hypothetical protein
VKELEEWFSIGMIIIVCNLSEAVGGEGCYVSPLIFFVEFVGMNIEERTLIYIAVMLSMLLYTWIE